MKLLKIAPLALLPLLLVVGFVAMLATLLLGSGQSSWAQAACIDARIEQAGLSESAGVPPEYVSLVEQAGMEHGVPPAVLAGLIEVESNWDPDAIGPVTYTGERAQGIAQFMPGTADSLGIDPFDPTEAIFGAALYLAEMTEMFDGNIELGLAAYNAGPGRVIDAGNQIPQIEETQNYVPAVLEYAAVYSGDDELLSSDDEGFICPPPGDAGEAAELAVEAAMTQLGNQYTWGGNTPDEGFDCSGLMVWAYNQAGVQLPARQSTAMYEAGVKAGQAVPNPEVEGNLQPGDLVFWATGRLGSDVSHVAMYVGDGQILEARTRNSPIEITEMRWEGFVGATRPVPQEDTADNDNEEDLVSLSNRETVVESFTAYSRTSLSWNELMEQETLSTERTSETHVRNHYAPLADAHASSVRTMSAWGARLYVLNP